MDHSVGDLETVIKSSIFDPVFYRLLYSDIGSTNDDAYNHYFNHGIWENRAPNPFFDPAFYYATNSDVAEQDLPAILHYLRFGGREWRLPSPMFDVDRYYENYSGRVAQTGTGSILEDFATSNDRSAALQFFKFGANVVDSLGEPLSFNDAVKEFFRKGILSGQNPNPLVELERVIGEGDVPFPTAFERFSLLFHAKRTAHYPNVHPLFDSAFYCRLYGDPGVHPMVNFFRRSPFEDRLINALIDLDYLRNNYGMTGDCADITCKFIEAGPDALAPNAYFDLVEYRERYAGHMKAEETETCIEHYLRHGRLMWFEPSERFGQRYYLTQYSAHIAPYQTALGHYLETGRGQGFAPLPPRPYLDRSANLSRAEVVSAITTAAGRKPDVQPVVTVVVAAYKQIDYTLRCLLSLFLSKDKTPFSVVVVDDNSPDGSGKTLAEAFADTPHIEVQRNPENLGFLRSCNNAAATVVAAGKSEYLFFLNNDTYVVDRWLDELVDTMRHVPKVGLVGSKLLYPNGLLQEAGGIVFNDGTAANYGRLDDPQYPAYCFLRDADYISGAAVLIRTRDWVKVGGFSDYLAPAYYEDTDLAMKVREMGLRVVYQPHSMVVHFEGISSGTDLGSGMKRFQVVNQAKFQGRWADTLETYGKPRFPDSRAADWGVKGRILVVDAEVPQPDRDSGSVTAFNALRIMAELGYRVTFMPSNLSREARYSVDIERLGVQVLHRPYVSDAERYVLDHLDDFDLVFASRATAGGHLIPKIKAKRRDLPVVFDTVDLHYLRLIRQWELTRDQKILDQAMHMRDVELSCINHADATIIVSEFEEQYLRDEIGPFPGVILPLIYQDYTPKTSFRERSDIAFVGGYRHTPNVDAVEYLMSEVWPRIASENLGARLHLIGSHMPASFREYASDSVIIAGFVEDLEGYLENIRVTVAPLRYGAGVKGKVGNSLRMGVPVVASPVAVEGMGFAEGDVTTASDPVGFAQQVARLYSNEELWYEMQKKGKTFADNAFGMEAAARVIRELCRGLIR